MKLKPYPKYKDSCIQWIGKIPEGWEVRRLKYLVKDLSGNGFPEEEQGKDVGDMPFYKVSDINGPEKFVEKATNFVSKRTIKDNKWNIIPKYSLIAPKIGEALKKNHRKITKVECIVDNNCIAFKSFDIDYNYNYYLFNLVNFEWFVNPGAVPSLSVEKLRSLIVPLVLLPEQTAIASFLDKRTAKIDTLIEKDKKLIELLKEKRTALINHAVTKGLDPNVKLKDSWIEWIGEIPEGWKVIKLKFIADEMKEKERDGKEKPLLGLENIESSTTKIIEYNSTENIEGESLKFEKNDVLFGKLRPYLAKVALVDRDGCCTSELIVYKSSKKILPKFLMYKLVSKKYVAYVNSLTYGVKMPRADPNTLSNIKQSIPPFEVQQKVAQYLNKATSKIDKTIKLIEEKIKLLEEYKKSLIHHVVTGKVDVRKSEV